MKKFPEKTLLRNCRMKVVEAAAEMINLNVQYPNEGNKVVIDVLRDIKENLERRIATAQMEEENGLQI